MRKYKKEQLVHQKLDINSVEDYLTDMAYIANLRVAQHTKDWIEMRMYELRASSNMYERKLATLLRKYGIKYIHQAPFVFYGKKIYFADFYLPDHKIIIEVDGTYHMSDKQFKYDRTRDTDFSNVRITTMRIGNAELADIKRVMLRLSPIIKRQKDLDKKKL